MRLLPNKNLPPRRVGQLALAFAASLVLVTRSFAADDTVSLPRFEVTGQLIGESLSPLTRPTTGILGDGRTLLDTPRAASTLTPALLVEQGVASLADLAAYAP